MADIYQEIWTADQAHAGLKAVKKGDEISAETRKQGYVVVDEKPEAGREHKLIPDVFIPEGKANSYKRVEKLFNNYTLDQTKRENSFPEEVAEVQTFIEEVYKTPPMEVARQYLAAQANREVSYDEWWAVLQRIWFEHFDLGKGKDLSGFEHVLVGEQEQGKLKGYHFWYKYYMDEHFRAENEELDLINFFQWKNKQQDTTPDCVTLSYQVMAFDYEAREYRPLIKPIGGFWVGTSAEGLMALGTVRCLAEALAPKRAVINGVIYNLPMYRSANDRNLRTFYLEFVDMVGQG